MNRTPRNSGRGLCDFLCFRGKCCPFDSRSVFFGDFPSSLGVFFRVPSVLGFFSRRICRYELWIDCPEFFGEDFGP